jgi:hypothetical protein
VHIRIREVGLQQQQPLIPKDADDALSRVEWNKVAFIFFNI